MKKITVTALVVLAGLFIFGTFFDLNIAKVVFIEGNAFSAFCEHFAPLVLGIVILLGSTFLFWTNDFRKNHRSWLKLTLSGLGYLLFGAYGALLPYAYNGMLGIIVVIIVLVGGAYFTYRLPGELKSDFQKVGLIIVLSALASTLIVELIKPVWGRVRFRSMGGNDALFTPWYSINGDHFLLFVPESQEIKSFPSGHSQWGMLTVLLSLIAVIHPKWQRHQNAVLFVSFLFAAVIMLSRMMQGAHFLTDVIAGAFVALLCVIVFSRLILRNYRSFNG